MKLLKLLGAVLGLLIVAIGVAFAVGIPGGFIAGTIEDRIEKETGYQLDINGGATIKLWPLTAVTLSDVTLSDPRNRDVPQRLQAESIRADLSLRSLLAGEPHVREISVVRPVVNLQIARERTRQVTTTKSSASFDRAPLTIDRVVISDATLVLKDPRHHVESKIEKVNVQAIATPERKLELTAAAAAGAQTFKLEAQTPIPTGPVDGMTAPVGFKLEAPGLLSQALSGNADVKFSGATISVNNLTGMFGAARFGGDASVEATAKPLVKVNLDFKQLDIDAPSANNSTQPQSWSEEVFNLDGLNYVDADFRVSTATLNIGALRLAPAKIEGSLASGILKMTLNELGLYEGKAAAGLALDASIANPIYALRADLRGVRALPLLTNLADFTSLDGKMQAQLDVRTTGRSQREMIANLSGTTNVDFQDGQIRGINVAQMIRNLTSSTLSGWQENEVLTTDLTELQASFRIASGKAETRDLRLAGPLVRVAGTGAADLNTKSLSFRLEPKLVMTTKGQGSEVADPIGLGVPVIMDGPWASPRIYPEMAGILDNPDAAFAKLRELGQGLFGSGSSSVQPDQPGQTGQEGNKLIENLGTIIQGLTGSGNGQSKSGNAAPQPGQAPPATPPGQGQPSPNTQSQIDSIIRQLFGR
ncbi:AsmA family protein [Bradyrhizobium sp. LHD-71]|uniref:AsmA family protein n=1 Tax=Bradyrhizobium sp. LHD-71 TaxID=3072141 RepID=UPI00280CF4AA|nr:AsmA family protein [Bradyrhizobium sp. LHD-71]MDQ8727126.1 AsmA family protein [Bradyrhizobium sp. LHD-71]